MAKRQSWGERIAQPFRKALRGLRAAWGRRSREGEGERPSAFRLGRAIALLLLASSFIYVLMLIVRFTSLSGDDLRYPQRAMTTEVFLAPPGDVIETASGEKRCADSQIVAMMAHQIEFLSEHNTWIPGDPQYKFGYFGLIAFEPGPFFDNKYSFQLGVLRANRRIAVELVDLLGRERGTSGIDHDLSDARGLIHTNERAWRINPFDSRVPFLSTSAASAFRNASRKYRRYNNRLALCDALFDGRSDNVFHVFDRISKDIGSMTDKLTARSKGRRWSVRDKMMMDSDGNDRGIFDFRADNLFHLSRGMMWSYFGFLQAMRVDFGQTVAQSNLEEIWDRLERHMAEAAGLDPLMVSNGREDSLVMPDHLSIMAVNMLRALANLQEIREIVNR